MALTLAPRGNAVTDLKRCISRKVVPVGVADVARLQVAPQELSNSGESGYPKVRHGYAREGWQHVGHGNWNQTKRKPRTGRQQMK